MRGPIKTYIAIYGDGCRIEFVLICEVKKDVVYIINFSSSIFTVVNFQFTRTLFARARSAVSQ